MTLPGDGLRGSRILVTRPLFRAGGLCRLIENSGGEAVCFPTLEVVRIDDVSQAIEQFRRLDRFDWVIFISANAVKFSQKAYNAEFKFPVGTKIAAIGKATANTLNDAGVCVNLLPKQPFSSEALLETAEMQAVEGHRILIVKGEGGRKFLGECLAKRGAEVCFADVYRRRRPRIDGSSLIESWHNRAISCAIVTSGESLDNLVVMMGREGWLLLKATPMIVISSRLKTKALGIGIQHILTASEASDEGIFSAICKFNELYRSTTTTLLNNGE